MKTTFRKQYSKNYQVFEVTVEDVPTANTEAVLSRMDEVGAREINNMCEALKITSVTDTTPTPTYAKPAYTPKENNYTNNNNYGGGNGGYKPQGPSAKQLEYLKQHNVEFDPNTITKKEASDLLEVAFANADSKKGGNKSYNSKPSAPKVETSDDVYARVSIDLDESIPF